MYRCALAHAPVPGTGAPPRNGRAAKGATRNACYTAPAGGAWAGGVRKREALAAGARTGSAST